MRPRRPPARHRPSSSNSSAAHPESAICINRPVECITSTGRLLFAHRYPRGRRANFGIFSIPEPTSERTDARNRIECPCFEPPAPQRPLIFNGMRPMGPAFRPKPSMQAPAGAEYSQKCTSHPTPGKRQLNLFRPIITRRGNTEPVGQRAGSLPAHSAGRKNPRRSLCAGGFFTFPRTRREGTCSLPGRPRESRKASYATV